VQHPDLLEDADRLPDLVVIGVGTRTKSSANYMASGRTPVVHCTLEVHDANLLMNTSTTALWGSDEPWFPMPRSLTEARALRRRRCPVPRHRLPLLDCTSLSDLCTHESQSAHPWDTARRGRTSGANARRSSFSIVAVMRKTFQPADQVILTSAIIIEHATSEDGEVAVELSTDENGAHRSSAPLSGDHHGELDCSALNCRAHQRFPFVARLARGGST
jgi:hypothetical protein